MEKFKNLHLWMLVPFIIVQVTIFNYYWPSFTSEHWEIHIHFWLVTFWYVLTISQPYLAVNGKISDHRTWGIIGFTIAGGAIFTGFSLLDFPLKMVANFDPNRPGPPAAFFYGTLVIEFVLMLAFTYAILKGTFLRKNLQEHAWWLIVSAFLMMPPALGRGMVVFWSSVLSPENFNPVLVFVTTELVYVPLLFVFASKFGKIKHQATYIALFLVFFRFLRVPIGSSKIVQDFLNAVIQWY